jgi:hypothetical protein
LADWNASREGLSAISEPFHIVDAATLHAFVALLQRNARRFCDFGRILLP